MDINVDERHCPVLLSETLEWLRPAIGELFVDATLGLGGHAEAFLDHEPGLRLIGIDKDPKAIEIAKARLARFGSRFEAVEEDFRSLPEILAARGIEQIDGFVADLGVSSLQFDDPERGFSFRFDAPLDMRMGRDGPTAADIVNRYDEQNLIRVFRSYGEDPLSKAIARRIVRKRSEAPIRTTGELARLCAEVKRGRPGVRRTIDPATQTFQALRIEVNKELEGLDQFLADTIERLRPNGRIGVIAFHSLEDRVVKHTFRNANAPCRCAPGLPVCVCGRRRVLEILTRRPVRPTPAEVAANPRARSARLRVGRRIAP